MKHALHFEPASSFTRQDELFPGKWIDDGSADGLYCTHYPESWIVRFLTKLDRDATRREAAKAVQTFDAILDEAGTIPSQVIRNHRRSPGIIWRDDMEISYPLFLFLVRGNISYNNRECRTKGQL